MQFAAFANVTQATSAHAPQNLKSWAGYKRNTFFRTISKINSNLVHLIKILIRIQLKSTKI